AGKDGRAGAQVRVDVPGDDEAAGIAGHADIGSRAELVGLADDKRSGIEGNAAGGETPADDRDVAVGILAGPRNDDVAGPVATGRWPGQRYRLVGADLDRGAESSPGGVELTRVDVLDEAAVGSREGDHEVAGAVAGHRGQGGEVEGGVVRGIDHD